MIIIISHIIVAILAVFLGLRNLLSKKEIIHIKFLDGFGLSPWRMYLSLPFGLNH